MPTTTTHSVGTFMWPELMTTDIAGAKAFYMPLLGWDVKENDMGEMGKYYIFTRDGAEVAAGYQMGPDMKGIPSNWGAYVRVDSADASAEKAKSLGGELMMGPFDVDASGKKHGRMAVIKDPIGAVFCVWQPIEHQGVGMLGEPGSLVWMQLNATDTEKAKAFYTKLIGWTAKDDPNPMGGTYTTWLRPGGETNGAAGMMAMPAGAPAPSHWLSYWRVVDAKASHAKAESLGAKTFLPVTELPGMGRFCVMADPQGAVFALFEVVMG